MQLAAQRAQSLHALNGRGVETPITLALLLANVALNIYSDLGLSAQIMRGGAAARRAPQAAVPSEPGRRGRRMLANAASSTTAAPPPPVTTPAPSLAPSNMTCGTAADSARFRALSRFDMDSMLTGCGGACGARALKDAECVTECVRVSGEYGPWSNGCAVCFGDYSLCIANECFGECSGGITPACNKCSRINCMAPFHECAGARIKTPGACGSASDLNTWDSRAPAGTCVEIYNVHLHTRAHARARARTHTHSFHMNSDLNTWDSCVLEGMYMFGDLYMYVHVYM